MKELLAALAAFGQNPDAIGDNLFTFFASITHMGWEDVVAAGCAISVLRDEAWTAALKRDKDAALKDPTVVRLRFCFVPVVQRVGQLILEAPPEKREMMLKIVTYNHGGGFIDIVKVDEWRKALAATATGNVEKETLKGLWGGYVVTTTNGRGEKFKIRTDIGVRGIDIPVTVIFEGDKCTVLERGRPVEVKEVTKVL